MSQLFASDGQSTWSFSFSISPSSEYSGLISFRIDWFDLLEVQGALKSLLQHHSSKASILWGLGHLNIKKFIFWGLEVQEILKSLTAPQFKSINSSVLSLHYGPTLISVLDYWKNHIKIS